MYEVQQLIKYSYDFDNYKILDFLGLSEALKKASSLSYLNESVKKIKNVERIMIQVKNVREQLIKQTVERFDNAFEAKNAKAIVECINVFFNLEQLRDQVQSKVNQSLKSISHSWRQAISSVQNISQVEMEKQEEHMTVQRALITGVTDMTKNTQKVYVLAICLNQRDP